MKLQSPSRIIAEDFDKEHQPTVSRLGSILNTFIEEVYQVMTSKINILDNMNQEIKIIKATVDASGNPVIPISFKNNLNSKVNGLCVIRAFGSVPTAQPFITFTESNKIIKVTNVLGLQANQQYQLVVLVIGD